MDDQRSKKKTLTISRNISKKIDLSSLSRDGKKTFSIEKKTPFRLSKDNKSNIGTGGKKKNRISQKKCCKEIC